MLQLLSRLCLIHENIMFFVGLEDDHGHGHSRGDHGHSHTPASASQKQIMQGIIYIAIDFWDSY